jgi:hypothetical protein
MQASIETLNIWSNRGTSQLSDTVGYCGNNMRVVPARAGLDDPQLFAIVADAFSGLIAY